MILPEDAGNRSTDLLRLALLCTEDAEVTSVKPLNLNLAYADLAGRIGQPI